MKQQLHKLLFKYDYLSEQQIRGFDNYKYSSLDTSPLSNYVSHPFWDWLVKFVPTWVAPNALTLSGFLCALAPMLVASVLDYRLLGATEGTPLPNWLWLLFSILVFLAHTLDGIDGKQARHTGTAGPLGELFDHGLDSWATLPFTVTIMSAFGRDNPYSVSATRFLAVLNSVQLVFFVTHWEKYNTGVLYLSWGYDVSQYGLALFYLIVYFIGYKGLWMDVGPFTFAHVFEFFFYLAALASVVVSLYNMHQAYCVTKTGQQQSVLTGARPALDFAAFVAVGLLHANYSRSAEPLIDVNPRLCYWLNGAVFSNLACRLIVAQMSATRPGGVNALLAAYATLPLVSLAGVAAAELAYAWLLTAVATAAHVHYGCSVVRQLCEHFHIRPFCITKRSPAPSLRNESRHSPTASTAPLLSADDTSPEAERPPDAHALMVDDAEDI